MLITEVSEIETTFLDTSVFKKGRLEKKRILDVRTHFRPIETFQSTHLNSCNLAEVERFAKGESLRLLRTKINNLFQSCCRGQP